MTSGVSTAQSKKKKEKKEKKEAKKKEEEKKKATKKRVGGLKVPTSIRIGYYLAWLPL